ncbi:hypothetical protein T09_9296 [Trichinella sp. T9]|nr:hypothetical protein T09_9296 [Trichinella sp. T9]
MKVLVFLAEDPGLIPSTCSQPWQQTHMHCTPLA